MPRRILLLEFNELCPALLQKWMAAGKLPNFKAFYDQSQAYITLADAEPPALEPWIQWYSIHTGLDFGQHGVFRLSDGARATHDDIWTVLQRAGLRTANCSSLNSRGTDASGSFFLPDPWNATTAPFPRELLRFHRFVAAQVRDHTDRARRNAASDLSDFLLFAFSHGLRPRTIAKITRQLASECATRRDMRWKRVAILDLIQTDIFLHYFRKMRPDFATFFLNSTAHLQHAYWRHMDPESFEAKPSPEQIAMHGNTILHGYQSMDRLMPDFFKLEKEGVTLVMATALSQQPFLKYEDCGGQRFYRPRDLPTLLELVGIRPRSLEPLMAHQFILRFNSVEEKSRAVELLSRIRYQTREALSVYSNDYLSICVANEFRGIVPSDAKISIGNPATTEGLFRDFFYLIEETKSGCHHPEGVLWFKTGRGKFHERKASVLDVFPTVLDFMEVSHSPSESDPRKGRSLISDWSVENALA
jgi:Type I phosphodiesterase / nucleotide pyrophosphatase